MVQLWFDYKALFLAHTVLMYYSLYMSLLLCVYSVGMLHSASVLSYLLVTLQSRESVLASFSFFRTCAIVSETVT